MIATPIYGVGPLRSTLNHTLDLTLGVQVKEIPVVKNQCLGVEVVMQGNTSKIVTVSIVKPTNIA